MSNESDVIVKITAYRGVLVIDGPVDFKHEDWTPFGADRIGCVINDTKKHLGVSPEALELLKAVEKTSHSVGDVDWWKCADGRFAFGWMGTEKTLSQEPYGSRQYEIGDHVVISNDQIPQSAVETIDDQLGPVK